MQLIKIVMSLFAQISENFVHQDDDKGIPEISCPEPFNEAQVA